MRFKRDLWKMKVQKWSWSSALFLFASLTCHRIDGQFQDDAEIENGDRFIDKLLYDMLEENGHEYDPYKLEDSSVGFSKKVLFVNVSGEAKLHNGYVTGLRTIHRPDHCSVEEKDGRLNVKADLGAGVMDFYYDGTVTFMTFGPTIRVHGELAYMEVHMEFSVDSKTGRDGELTKFTIDDLKGLTITMSGLGPLNWAMNYIISGVTTIFKGFMRNFMEKKVKSHLEEKLPNYQFPVDGGDVKVITDNPTETTETPEEPEVELPEGATLEEPEELQYLYEKTKRQVKRELKREARRNEDTSAEVEDYVDYGVENKSPDDIQEDDTTEEEDDTTEEEDDTTEEEDDTTEEEDDTTEEEDDTTEKEHTTEDHKS